MYFPFRDIFDDSADTSPGEPLMVTGGYRLDTEASVGEQFSCDTGDTLFWLWTARQ